MPSGQETDRACSRDPHGATKQIVGWGLTALLHTKKPLYHARAPVGKVVQAPLS